MSQPRLLYWLWVSQSVSNSYSLSANESSRTSNFNVFCFEAARDRTTNLPHARADRSTTTLPGHRQDTSKARWSVLALACSVWKLSQVMPENPQQPRWGICRWGICRPLQSRDPGIYIQGPGVWEKDYLHLLLGALWALGITKKSFTPLLPTSTLLLLWVRACWYLNVKRLSPIIAQCLWQSYLFGYSLSSLL